MFLLVMLAARVLSGSPNQQIVLERGILQRLEFSCPAHADAHSRSGIICRFSGVPAWLTARASFLIGTVPADATGQCSIGVSYWQQGGTPH